MYYERRCLGFCYNALGTLFLRRDSSFGPCFCQGTIPQRTQTRHALKPSRPVVLDLQSHARLLEPISRCSQCTSIYSKVRETSDTLFLSFNQPLAVSVSKGHRSIFATKENCFSDFRDLNQLLYKVFNAKKVHTYVTMPDEPVGSNSPYSPLGSVKTVQTSAGSEMDDLDEDSLQSFGALPATSNTLVPMFERFMKDRMPNFSQGSSWADSSQNLISRSGSSMDYGSLPTTYSYRSQLTMQTSLSNWSLMTMPSIYCIEGKSLILKERCALQLHCTTFIA